MNERHIYGHAMMEDGEVVEGKAIASPEAYMTRQEVEALLAQMEARIMQPQAAQAGFRQKAVLRR